MWFKTSNFKREQFTHTPMEELHGISMLAVVAITVKILAITHQSSFSISSMGYFTISVCKISVDSICQSLLSL